MSMDPPPAPEANGPPPARSNSFSQHSQASDDSQTAAEFIRDQEALEADAREALPYSIDKCSKLQGSLRQNVYACLTCNPPSSTPWSPAGFCYGCSVSCHGEHTLVEIFQKRNFTCDCGTTRVPSTSPCTLQINAATNTRGGVHSGEPDANNRYNQNFRNKFCGCEGDYDPFQQKGTMFQCLGLGTTETGGCGEDWYHPGCLVGKGPKWYEKMQKKTQVKAESTEAKHGENGSLPTIAEGAEGQDEAAAKAEEAVVDDEDDVPLPEGFPDEDDFEGFLCYKCVESNPWIKQYAGTAGFLPAVFYEPEESKPAQEETSKKRKADDEVDDASQTKRAKSDAEISEATQDTTPATATASAPASATESESKTTDQPSDCKLRNFPPAPPGRFNLFFKDAFRTSFCTCKSCYIHLSTHPQLLEEEETYEPSLSASSHSHHNGGSTNGSGSLLERGESALRNVDRVRAIEGVMAYNHLKEQLKPFFQEFADSGKAIGAEDIKAYFAKLRGDEQGIKEAGEAAAGGGDDNKDGGNRREQSGY